METDTRSIAEIIGWERWPFVYYLPPDHASPDSLFPTPTVDDLLAWLSAFVLDTYANAHGEMVMYYEQGGAFVSWWTPDGMDEAEGPTLLAALEAAVRSVTSEASA